MPRPSPALASRPATARPRQAPELGDAHRAEGERDETTEHCGEEEVDPEREAEAGSEEVDLDATEVLEHEDEHHHERRHGNGKADEEPSGAGRRDRPGRRCRRDRARGGPARPGATLFLGLPVPFRADTTHHVRP